MTAGESDWPSLSLIFFPYETREEESAIELVLRSARFADDAGFEAIWIPERHFHRFGGLFPNSAVIAAVLARETSRVRLRGGSVIAPLHDPLRVAEEWALVDRLSGGRVDLAFGTGWNPDDFVLNTAAFERRGEVTSESIADIKRLWSGTAIERRNGLGETRDVLTYPRPVQAALTTWLTCSGPVERFENAGADGHNVLTALLFHDLRSLREKIAVYRSARLQAGYDTPGRVTCMLHAFVDDGDDVEALVRGPMTSYVSGVFDLWAGRMGTMSRMSPDRMQRLLDFAITRQIRTCSLVGTSDACRRMIDRAANLGIDEIACLVDFGLTTDRILTALPKLAALLGRTQPTVPIM